MHHDDDEYSALLTLLLAWSPVSRRWIGVRLGRMALASYMFYIMVMDRLTAKQGGRPQAAIRAHPLWKQVCLLHDDDDDAIMCNEQYVLLDSFVIISQRVSFAKAILIRDKNM